MNLLITATAIALSAAALLGGCVLPPPASGRTEADVLREWGMPTGRYALPTGGQRLEYATGPYGRTTWMIDLDETGRVRGSEQVLNERRFADFQGRSPGMTRAEVLRELGRPGERRGGGRQGGELWSWRYPTNDCLWFQLSVGDDGRARDAGYGTDPTCDHGDARD